MSIGMLSNYPTYPVLDCWSKETPENRIVVDAIYDRLADHGFTRVTDETDSEHFRGDLAILGWDWKFSLKDGDYFARVYLAEGTSPIRSKGWLPTVAIARSIDEQIRSLHETGDPTTVRQALARLKPQRD